jgi:hypothetical protein
MKKKIKNQSSPAVKDTNCRKMKTTEKERVSEPSDAQWQTLRFNWKHMYYINVPTAISGPAYMDTFLLLPSCVRTFN